MRKKLVRDKIPNLIRKSGKVPVFHRAKKEDMSGLLFDKFIEEINEFLAEPSAEEAADIFAVLEALCKENGISMVQVTQVAAQKGADKGKFKKRYVLEDIR
jgi:predicted house-cleaning noncanonical NTP pyrophosphatase (MazG superfamily)